MKTMIFSGRFLFFGLSALLFLERSALSGQKAEAALFQRAQDLFEHSAAVVAVVDIPKEGIYLPEKSGRCFKWEKDPVEGDRYSVLDAGSLTLKQVEVTDPVLGGTTDSYWELNGEEASRLSNGDFGSLSRIHLGPNFFIDYQLLLRKSKAPGASWWSRDSRRLDDGKLNLDVYCYYR